MINYLSKGLYFTCNFQLSLRIIENLILLTKSQELIVDELLDLRIDISDFHKEFKYKP